MKQNHHFFGLLLPTQCSRQKCLLTPRFMLTRLQDHPKTDLHTKNCRLGNSGALEVSSRQEWDAGLVKK